MCQFYLGYIKTYERFIEKCQTNFFLCPYKRGGEIQTSDFRFMRRGPSRLSCPLGTSSN